MKDTIRNFKVYKSSAGSGKTTTLVMEYLRLTIPNPDRFNEIVGITFTIKATNEMKSRVLKVLEKIIESGGDFDSISNIIYEQIKLEHGFTKAKFTENANKLLGNILHGYSNFAFSTIDSFILKIVKSFAFDLNLPINFEIELDSDIVIDEAVAALISKAGYDEQLTKNLLKYIEHQADDESDTRIHVLISDLAKVLFNDSFNEFQKAIGKVNLEDLQVFSNLIIKRRKVLYEHIRQLGSEAIAMIQQRNIDPKRFYYGNSGGIPAYFNYLKNGIIAKIIPKNRLQESIANEKWFAGSCPVEVQSEILSISEELVTLYEEVQLLIPEFLGIDSLRKNIESILLIGEVNLEIQNYYQENSVIHLSETVKKVSEVVSKEQMPFIYERIGAKYRHFLIDEFQDTSVVQWRNLVPLLDNSLSEGNYNLIVGDAKQSIYRWRGGDFQQFIDLPSLIGTETDSLLRERQENLSRNFDEVFLAKNYRSYKSVVSFNNHYYDFVKGNSNEIVNQVFNNHQQEYFQQEEGFVSLNIIPSHKTDEELFQARLMEIIHDLRDRNYTFGDITILARKNDQLSYIAELLLSHNIPIISSQSLKLFSSIHVQFCLNFIRWISEKEDKISRTAVLFYLKAESFLNENQLNSFQLINSDNELLDFIFENKNTYQGLSASNDVALIIEFLATRFLLYTKEYAFIVQLLNFVKIAESVEGLGFMNFLEYVDRRSKNEFLSMPDKLNAVNLLTIHKSKGLEFPVVIWVDFISRSPKRDYLSVDIKKLGIKKPEVMLVKDNKLLSESTFKSEKEEAEELSLADQINLAYVATTRPKKELYIIAEEKSSHYENLSAFSKTDFFIKEEDGDTFTLGQKVQNKKDSTEEMANETLDYDSFTPWFDRISMRKGFVEGSSGREGEDLRKKGQQIHSLLSQVNVVADVEALLDKEISIGRIREDERNTYENLIKKIVENKEVSSYFDRSWEVLNERAIFSSHQNVYRPDRVLVSKESAVVIDYKYSDYSLVEEIQQNAYITQVKKYMNLLQEIYPDRIVNGKILWIKGDIYLQNIN